MLLISAPCHSALPPASLPSGRPDTAPCPPQAADTDKRTKGDQPALDEREFVTFYHSLLKRPDLEAIFSR